MGLANLSRTRGWVAAFPHYFITVCQPQSAKREAPPLADEPRHHPFVVRAGPYARDEEGATPFDSRADQTISGVSESATDRHRLHTDISDSPTSPIDQKTKTACWPTMGPATRSRATPFIIPQLLNSLHGSSASDIDRPRGHRPAAAPPLSSLHFAAAQYASVGGQSPCLCRGAIGRGRSAEA